ncbi:MAG TPA: hypothetical protein VGM07_01075 [Stellaceae bacterium]|jgi:hypothetical protein
MTRLPDSPAMLSALLDALEAELLAAPIEEVRDTLHSTGRARGAACQEVRSLLHEAGAATGEGSARTRLHDTRHGPLGLGLGLYRH